MGFGVLPVAVELGVVAFPPAAGALPPLSCLLELVGAATFLISELKPERSANSTKSLKHISVGTPGLTCGG